MASPEISRRRLFGLAAGAIGAVALGPAAAAATPKAQLVAVVFDQGAPAYDGMPYFSMAEDFIAQLRELVRLGYLERVDVLEQGPRSVTYAMTPIEPIDAVTLGPGARTTLHFDGPIMKGQNLTIAGHQVHLAG